MNPFSLPNSDPELYISRERQRSVEQSTLKELRLIPIHLRKESKTSDILHELRTLPSSLDSSFKKNKRSHSYNRENIQELILRKREILLTKKKIEHKKLSISLLDTITEKKEEDHKKAVKALEDNLIRVEKYEENLKTEAKKKADIAEKKLKERIVKQNEINSLQQEIEYLAVSVGRKKEELKHLTVFKEFVEELSNSNENLKPTTFLTEGSDTLRSSAFLLDHINSLEKKNLFLIQQAQEGEQNLENLKSKFQSSLSSLSSKNEKIKQNIKHLEKVKEITTLKLTNLANEQMEKPLVSRETMELIHKALLDIYYTVGGDSSVLPTDFEILEVLENSIRFEMEKLKLYNEDIVKHFEQATTKARRSKNAKALSIKEIAKAKEISETLQRRNQKVVKKSGRKNMERSKIPEKAEIKEKIVVPQEILDRREFLEEFVPYP
jgi:hypothetical protein